MKYELTSETTAYLGKTLYRIKALISFGAVQKGDLGGFVEKEYNLAQTDNAWVYGDAWVYGNARVSGDAMVYGNARVSGDAWVSGDAMVYGNARVSGDAMVSGNAWVYGDAWVYGNARVSPINLIGCRYPVTITDTHLQIGCEHHLITEWETFSDSRIIEMEGREALKWWRIWKEPVLSIARAAGRPLPEDKEKAA